MAEHHLKRIRPLGKLEEISAVAHHIDFFTNTGLSVHYKSSAAAVVDLKQLIYAAVAEVLRVHPILFAVPVAAGSKEPYWGHLPSIDLKQSVLFVERNSPLAEDGKGRDRELDAILENQHNTSFKSGYGTVPVWRLIILQSPGVQNAFTACFIAHHAMSDGTALQIFQNSFQKALCNASSKSSVELKADHIVLSHEDDPIAPSLEEVHPLPIPADPPSADPTSFSEWTGAPVQVPCKTRYVSLSLAPHLLQPFIKECRRQKVPPTAAIPALIARLIYSKLSPTVECLTCNLPVSLRSDLPPKVVEGVMGNFIDAFKVKLLRSEMENPEPSNSSDADSYSSSYPLGIWNHARKIQQSTRRYFSNTSPNGQPYTNIAFFKLIPDLGAALSGTLGTARGESFEVSNLGSFPQPANLKGGPSPTWQVGKVLLSRCAYAAGGPLVVCLLNSDENVGFGFTWQEGAVDDDVVEAIINGVRTYFDPTV